MLSQYTTDFMKTKRLSIWGLFSGFSTNSVNNMTKNISLRLHS